MSQTVDGHKHPAAFKAVAGEFGGSRQIAVRQAARLKERANEGAHGLRHLRHAHGVGQGTAGPPHPELRHGVVEEPGVLKTLHGLVSDLQGLPRIIGRDVFEDDLPVGGESLGDR